MTIRTTTRRWGNSIAVVIPKEVVERKRLHEDQEISITVEITRPTLSKLFGRFPRNSKKTAQQLKDEIREGWESGSDKARWR